MPSLSRRWQRPSGITLTRLRTISAGRVTRTVVTRREAEVGTATDVSQIAIAIAIVVGGAEADAVVVIETETEGGSDRRLVVVTGIPARLAVTVCGLSVIESVRCPGVSPALVPRQVVVIGVGRFVVSCEGGRVVSFCVSRYLGRAEAPRR